MARQIPEQRFDELVSAASEVFIARGYRLTQMSDIAEAVGVAKGTLYGYVESKEALFYLCLFHADRREPLARPEALPLPTPAKGQLSSQIKALLSSEAIPAPLAEALERDRADDPRAEFEAIVRTFYQTLERFCRAIKMLDRCVDHPELRDIWQGGAREAPRAALVRYLEARIAAGQIRPVRNVRLAARMIIEVATTWAIHIRWDRTPEDFDPDEARENAIDFLVHALVL